MRQGEQARIAQEQEPELHAIVALRGLIVLEAQQRERVVVVVQLAQLAVVVRLVIIVLEVRHPLKF